MATNKLFKVTCEIRTDYNMNELMEVISKLLDIPGLQYEDTDCFECKRISILDIGNKRKTKKWKAI